MKAKAGSNHIDAEIGLRMRRRRLVLGLSQTDLGKFLDVSFQQVQKYENGMNRISCASLVSICAALKVSSNYFFDGLADVSKKGPSETERFLATRHGIEGVTALMKLGPKVRESVIRMAEASAR